MKVSIAMATYNGAEFLQEQLDSFVLQTYQPDELVVCDDKSTDKTLEILHAFAEKAPFKVTIRQNVHQLGYTANFNEALLKTSGEVVFLSDQDDVWDKKKIETVIIEFEKNPHIQLLIHDLAFCNESLQPVGQTKLQRLKALGAKDRSYVTGMATAIRDEFLKKCLPIPEHALITHDSWLHNCAGVKGVKKVIPDVLALYRRHNNNATAQKTLNRAKKTSILNFIVSASSSETVRTLEGKRAILIELKRWLETNHESETSLSEVFVRIEMELLFCSQRLSLLNQVFPIRIWSAARLYSQGGYKPFLGLRSMFKDIFSS